MAGRFLSRKYNLTKMLLNGIGPEYTRKSAGTC